MSIEQAKRLGQKETLKWTLYTLLVAEFILLFRETRYDFANGILFYIEGHKRDHFLEMVIILFIVTYFFGQRNGKEILIDGKNFFFTPFKHGFLAVWIVLVYRVAIEFFRQTHGEGGFEIIQSYIIEPFLRTTLIFLLPISIYSYLCGYSINKLKEQ